MRYATITSPVGPLTLVSTGKALAAILFEPAEPELSKDYPQAEPGDDAVLQQTSEQLGQYFAGQRTTFELPLQPLTGSPFQRKVWQALADIPYGATWSYGQLAASLDKPSASRAVGGANGRNPLSIVVPCHRVIGANGSLTGYGGGLERKHVLLKLERDATQRRQRASATST